ncbi:AP2 domain-containing protein [Clostridium sp. 1001275B_160808_H3]|uniref:AP2 domain-containing protein n=1 Tax=Clostridium sp. 1001275B_160808_H3 TaxID=2787110 RepID=UPI00189BDDB8|nr:AP2 domain-containing protein [Clostridium sp. 1001275B_160808_H3]
MAQGVKRNLIGSKFNMLTIIDSEFRNKKTYYLCKCECGNEKWIRADSVTSEKQKSCGCLSKKKQFKHKDLTGNKIGRLTVLEEVNKKVEKYYYKCKCDCGNIKVIEADLLTTEKTKSCGCLGTENALNKQKIALGKYREKYLLEGTSLANISREKPIKSNTSGITGVTWDKSKGKWMAQIVFKGKSYYLGRYENKEDAVKARKEAEEKLHKEFLRKLEEK